MATTTNPSREGNSMSSPTPVNWFVLHPKAKILALAVAVLILGSIPAYLNGTVGLRATLTADITAAIGLLIVYMTPAKPAA